jgi:hypothetical protein
VDTKKFFTKDHLKLFVFSEIFVEIFELVIKKMMSLSCKRILIKDKDVGIIKILDSSTVTMSMKLFPRADYKTGVAGIKFHTIFDLAHSCPEEIKLTNAELHDVNLLDEMVSEPGMTYLYDRAYVDYKKADIQTLTGIYFVSRLKSNAVITVEEEIELPDGSEALEDKIVILGDKKNKMTTKVRIVLVQDKRSRGNFYIVTNRFDLNADEIS